MGAFGTRVGRQLILFIDVLIGWPHLTAVSNPSGFKAVEREGGREGGVEGLENRPRLCAVVEADPDG